MKRFHNYHLRECNVFLFYREKLISAQKRSRSKKKSLIRELEEKKIKQIHLQKRSSSQGKLEEKNSDEETLEKISIEKTDEKSFIKTKSVDEELKKTQLGVKLEPESEIRLEKTDFEYGHDIKNWFKQIIRYGIINIIVKIFKSHLR